MVPGTQNQKGISTVQLVIILLFVVLLVGVLFHKQIGRLLDTSESVTVKVPGIEVAIKTRDTPIGPVDVSVQPAPVTNAPIKEGIFGNSYISQKHRFQISWPSDDRWKPILEVPFSRRDELGLKNFNGVLEITNAGNWVLFPVSVIVGVRPALNNSIQAYVDEAIQQRRAEGWNPEWTIDPQTRSALIVLTLGGNDMNWVELQKIVLSADQVFTLTTGKMIDEIVASPQAKADITSILNSFRVL